MGWISSTSRRANGRTSTKARRPGDRHHPRRIAVTAPQTVWLASQLGLTRFSDGKIDALQRRKQPDDQQCRHGYSRRRRRHRVAGDGGRIVSHRRRKLGDLQPRHGRRFRNNGSIGLALAADGSVWIGTDQVRLCRLGANGVAAPSSSATRRVWPWPLTSLRLDEDGNVYYTTVCGIGMYDGERWQTPS